MAEILRYVDPNSTAGGDGTEQTLSGATRAYISMNAWEAATQQDLTAGGGNTARVVCSSNLDAGGGSADTSSTTIDGWTTDATHYITIEAKSGHGGKWNANTYRLEHGSLYGLYLYEQFFRIVGIQLYGSGNSSIPINATGWTSGDVRVSRCLFRGPGESATYKSAVAFPNVPTSGVYFYVFNNIAYDYGNTTGTSFGGPGSGLAGAYFYNNTIKGGWRQINVGSGSGSVSYVKNNLFVGGVTAVVNATAANCGYNSTDLASLGYTSQTGDRTSQSFTFVGYSDSPPDLHLASNDAGARDYGVSDPGSGLFSDDIDGVARTGTWDIGADEYVAAGGGSAYPYTGGVGDGAITQSAATQRIRGIVRELGGAQAYSAGTVKARGKVPVVGGDFSFNAATVKARGRVPTVGGAAAFSTGSIYSKATLYLYAGGASQVYSAESVKARGKSPIVGGSIIYAAASEYSKFSAPGTNYAYVGDGVLVFGNGSEHAIGRVYESGGAFHFAAGSVYVKTAGSNAYSYTGLASGAIVYTGATVIIYTRNRVHEDKPGVRTTTSESVPQSTTGQTEAKPGARAASHEALPTRPPGQDGFYADPAQDGFYDEYPAQGFYADIGYFKEFKPFHRATFTKEGKPS